jgi:hypothetical protein
MTQVFLGEHATGLFGQGLTAHDGPFAWSSAPEVQGPQAGDEQSESFWQGIVFVEGSGGAGEADGAGSRASGVSAAGSCLGHPASASDDTTTHTTMAARFLMRRA